MLSELIKVTPLVVIVGVTHVMVNTGVILKSSSWVIYVVLA